MNVVLKAHTCKDGVESLQYLIFQSKPEVVFSSWVLMLRQFDVPMELKNSVFFEPQAVV